MPAPNSSFLTKLRTVVVTPFVVIVISVVSAILWKNSAAYGADWPTYLHDNARSGVTLEQLDLPLSERWVFKPKHPPQPAWPEPVKERVRLCYDRAYYVTAVGDALYFGSSADNKIYSLDALTGNVRWSTFTGGAVRLAPTLWKNRVFAGSDDGYAYCLDANTGRELWKFKAAPNDRKVLGHGRMVSVWPIRTGVLVDDGVAYFCAGLFPTESVYLYAVRADDGKLLWKNDTSGQLYMNLPHGGTEGFSGIAPQGALLASDSRLYIPTGRNVPAAFDRKDGRFLYWHENTVRGGGTYALLSGDLIFNGPDRLAAFNPQTGDRFANFPGRRLIVTRDFSYLLTDNDLSAVDRKAYAELSRNQMLLDGRYSALIREQRVLDARQATLNRKLKNLSPEQKAQNKEQVELTKLRRALSEKQKALNEERTQNRKAIAASVKWRRPCKCPYSLIFAGGVLFAGGQDKVIAVDAATGEIVWTGKVTGRARGLAVSNGRLFVSTDNGQIYCFGKNKGIAITAETTGKEVTPAPYPQDKLTQFYAAVAERIIKETGVKKGYCLVFGSGKGRLAFELAKRTELHIYGIEPDEKKVNEARQALDAAELYGVRVTVDHGSLSLLPYSNYFANLIVCDDLLLSGRISGSAKELFRVLKPYGGVAYIGQPADAAKFGKPINADTLRNWLQNSGISDYQLIENDGVWAKIERGPLPGAGDWTHQYANAANTVCSTDQRVVCPLGLLWFGKPGPARMIDRHSHPPAPLSAGGRIFIPANERVIAIDAYNGMELWDRPMPGSRRVNMSRDAGDMVATNDSVFRINGSDCWRLDADTGKHTFTYSVPQSSDGQPHDWGYIAQSGGLLFGSATKPNSAYTLASGNFYSGVNQKAVTSEYLFAIDMKEGKLRWRYQNGIIINTAIAVGTLQTKGLQDERIFLIESRSDAAMKNHNGQMGSEILQNQFLVALDAQSGKKLWEKSADFRPCGTAVAVSYHRGIVIVWGTTGKCSLMAFSAKDGTLLWSRTYLPRDSRGLERPILINDTVYAEPFAYNLRTGKPKMRAHPITGEQVPWRMKRTYGCGIISAAPSCLFFRSGVVGFYDLKTDAGTGNWGGMRPGCWINIIPAAGLVLVPEASSGCICSYPIQTSVALIPMKRNENWSVFETSGAMTPVKHIAINIGAPGDKRDSDGTLWFSYPRPRSRFGVKFNLHCKIADRFGYFNHNSDTIEISGTNKQWLFASGCNGITQCTIPLIGKGQGPAIYTVRLYFAEPTNNRAGQRVFDVKLQGKVALKDFDIFKEAGGSNAAIIKECKGIKVTDNLAVEFISKTKNPTKEQMPIINAIELVKQS